jgi:hypothetical protein
MVRYGKGHSAKGWAMLEAVKDAKVKTKTTTKKAPILAVHYTVTWPRFRFAQRNFKGLWELVAAVSDEELSKVGYKLGSPWRSAADLDVTGRALLETLLLKRGDDLSDEERSNLAALLAKCPYLGPIPPIDFDVAKGTPRDEVVKVAELFRLRFQQAGCGLIELRSTGGKGIHGDQEAPDSFSSPLLLLAYRKLIRTVATQCGIPLLSDHMPKEGRPSVVIDDTLFNRQPEARGVLWRLVGARREDTGKVKLPLNETLSREKDSAYPYGRPVACNQLYILNNAIQEIHRERAEIEADSARPAPSISVEDAPFAKVTKKAPIPGFGKEPLKKVAEVLGKALPPEGKRHEFRLAVAGWLLRAGIPQRNTARTLILAGDTQDAIAVTKTTQARLDSGLKAVGFKRLLEIVGANYSGQLKDALAADLTKVEHFGVLDRFMTDREREILKAASKIAKENGETTKAKALMLAAWCGRNKDHGNCEGCGQCVSKRFLVSERAACPHCAFARARDLVTWITNKWPTKLTIAHSKISDDSVEAARAEKKRLKAMVCPEISKKLRWIIAPGMVVCLSHDEEAIPYISYAFGSDNAKFTSRFQALSTLIPMLTARTRRLRTYLADENAEALAADAWAGRVVETKAGREANTFLAWPSKAEARLLAKNASRARKGLPPVASLAEAAAEASISPCCKAGVMHDLIHENRIVAKRNDRAWDFESAYNHCQGLTLKGVFRTYETLVIRKDGKGLRAFMPRE